MRSVALLPRWPNRIFLGRGLGRNKHRWQSLCYELGVELIKMSSAGKHWHGESTSCSDHGICTGKRVVVSGLFGNMRSTPTTASEASTKPSPYATSNRTCVCFLSRNKHAQLCAETSRAHGRLRRLLGFTCLWRCPAGSWFCHALVCPPAPAAIASSRFSQGCRCRGPSARSAHPAARRMHMVFWSLPCLEHCQLCSHGYRKGSAPEARMRHSPGRKRALSRRPNRWCLPAA